MAQKRLRVAVAGKVFEVLVDVLDEDVHSAGARPGQTAPAAGTIQSSAARVEMPADSGANAAQVAPEGASQESGLILCPVSGSVVSVRCGLGDIVSSDTPVAVIEAMKMETMVYAGCSGRVQQIFAKAGDVLSEGQPLLKVM